MKRQLKNIIALVIERRLEIMCNKYSERRERQLLSLLGGGKCTDSERLWIEYWKPLVKCRSVWAFRLYSKFCGETKYILSQPIADSLNRALNPEELVPFYSDKNVFDMLLPKGTLPKTILRVMDGMFMDADYNIMENLTDADLSEMLEPYTHIIMKPTTDTSSGRGVCFIDRQSKKITVDFIKNAGNNLIVQEALKQSDFMSQFNPTSVNTVRIATYKSPYSGEVHILSAVIRMGASGAAVDNLHHGGHMIRVNEETGVLANKCYDANGVSSVKHGSIDFSRQSFIVPEWEKVKEFAKFTARKLPHMKLLQLDIAIDSDGRPRLLEYNVDGFSMWIAQFTGTPALGEYTDEIRRYALSKEHSIKIYQTRH